MDSHIVVAVSTDGLVHVKDLTSSRGAFFGDRLSVPQLDVKRTADGVSIMRPESNDSSLHFQFGWFERRVEVDVPADRTSTSRAAPAPKSAESPAALPSNRRTGASCSPT